MRLGERLFFRWLEKVSVMTNSEFEKICRLPKKNIPVAIKHKGFNVSGKFVGCWDNCFVIESNGQYSLWPWELCEPEKPDYFRPSYS